MQKTLESFPLRTESWSFALFLFSYSALLSNTSISCYPLLSSIQEGLLASPCNAPGLSTSFPSSSWPCLLFLLSISAHHFSFFKGNPIGASADLNLYVTQERKKREIKPVWNTICFLLCKIHHEFTSCHGCVSILLHISFSMETFSSLIEDRNGPHLGLLCVRGGGHCWEGECHWQTNGPGLFGTCVSQAPVVSWHVYIANHSQIAAGANRHLQLFVWPLPHK